VEGWGRGAPPTRIETGKTELSPNARRGASAKRRGRDRGPVSDEEARGDVEQKKEENRKLRDDKKNPSPREAKTERDSRKKLKLFAASSSHKKRAVE